MSARQEFTDYTTVRDLSPRTRLRLFHGTSTSVATALEIDAASLTIAKLREMGCTPANMRAAELTPQKLAYFGVQDAESLRSLGFDAFDLRELAFASECIARFGSQATRGAFVCAPSDAVALAGTQSAVMLGLTPEVLLNTTAGDAVAARTCLALLPTGALRTITLDTLLATGLQIPALAELGYSFAQIVAHFQPTPEQLKILGARQLASLTRVTA